MCALSGSCGPVLGSFGPPLHPFWAELSYCGFLLFLDAWELMVALNWRERGRVEGGGRGREGEREIEREREKVRKRES